MFDFNSLSNYTQLCVCVRVCLADMPQPAWQAEGKER